MDANIVAADLDKLWASATVYETAEQFAGVDEWTLPEDRHRHERANTARLQQNPAYVDYVFQTGKSVGLLWASFMTRRELSQAAVVLQAQREAVHASVEYLQKHAGVVQIGQTGACRYVDATLTFHQLEHTAHDGNQGNPHVHTHMILDTFATAERSRYPVYIAGIRDALTAVEAIYSRVVATSIHNQLGVRCERRNGRTAWEVAAISDAVIATTLPGTTCRPTEFQQVHVPALG